MFRPSVSAERSRRGLTAGRHLAVDGESVLRLNSTTSALEHGRSSVVTATERTCGGRRTTNSAATCT